MIRTSIFAGAAALASLLAAPAMAQPADPNYQAQTQDYQAKQQQYQGQVQAYDQKKQAYDAQRDTYAQQRAGYRSAKDQADDQRRLWLEGLAVYEAKYGRGSYEEYHHAHPDVTTTTVITPAGKAESRSSTTTIIETPAR